MRPKSIEELESKIFGELPFKAKAKDIKLIIEYAKEQSKRVQELIKAHELKDLENKGLVEQLKILQSDFLEIKRVAEMHRSNELKLEQQNKRYRERLELIKDRTSCVMAASHASKALEDEE